ncbi:MAG: efflux RND transporter permease subunit [Alphaproteobacteria bacterium]|nr:efflux RND transporter permease subunit [Alphaproteobacteria bacterium]
MNFTDIFIRRPVLASVVSLMILVIGLRALFSLPILQYPRTQNAVITVQTVYYGADADAVAGFITTPLENAIAQANGIDYMTSTSMNGVSTITVNLRLNYDPDKALTEISAKITSVRNELPEAAQEPTLTIKVGETVDSMYVGFNSNVLDRNAITDYLTRVVQPRLQAVEGVQTAEILGAQNFALRAWLDPQKLAAYSLTAADVSRALAANNYISGLGKTKGQMVEVTLNASTDIHSLEEFRNLIVKQKDGAVVRLKDIAEVTLGSDDYETRVSIDGKSAVFIGIQMAPSANLLQVIEGVRKVFPDIKAQLPQGMQAKVVYDATQFVSSSIGEVEESLIEAVVIVAFVVFMFLGSLRSVLIPIIAIPLSLIGAFIFMLVMGFSINLLTLLSLVLAIGLVVDDAIIVVENVNRHMEEGKSPLEASLIAARELGGPIIAMTIVLIAVYVPIGFQGGLTGSLFTEFAFTLVGAVTISGIVALTLSPMLCSKMFKPHDAARRGWEEKLVAFLDGLFDRLHNKYRRLLYSSLRYVPVTLTFAALILGSIYFLYSSARTELAPQEDQGVVFGVLSSAPNSTLEQRLMYADKVYQIYSQVPETDLVFQFDVPGMSFSALTLKPWDERERTTNDIQPFIQKEVSGVAGIRAAVFQPSPLPGAHGLPVQFVITSTQAADRMSDVVDNFMQEVRKSGILIFSDTDLKIDLPQSTVIIDRDKAAQLGLTMTDVGNAMSAMLGGGYVNHFTMSGRSYKVIPQVAQAERLTTQQLESYYIRAASGDPVALSTIAHIETKTVPQSRNHFQQVNSATVSGVPFPGFTVGQSLDTLKDIAARSLPEGYSFDYAGQSRQFMQESSGFAMTFLFAIIIIFLALAAQFESFRDPLIILISVPMSIAGALFFISLDSIDANTLKSIPGLLPAFNILGLGAVGKVSINIYTQVGLVTLMGLISKHGILIVEFANKLQEQGRSKLNAICDAASVRLRPILMTTAAMVLGVMPLITASGAGALARVNMGIVIASGLAVGTLFTLFVVPAVYLVLGTDHAAKLAKEKAAEATPPKQLHSV